MIDWDGLQIDALTAAMPLTPSDAELIREYHLRFRQISPRGDYARRPTRLLGFYGELTYEGELFVLHGPWRPTGSGALRALFRHWKRLNGFD